MRINAALQQTQDRTNRAIGDLRAYVDQHSGMFAEELRAQLDLLEVGGQRLDEFVAKVGDWVIQTEDGTQRVRELVEGLDARGFEQDIQALIAAARNGGDALADAIDLLRQRGGALTAQLVQAIEAFQRGSGTLDRILRLVEQLKTVTGGDTALDDLLEAIAAGLDEGQRDGSL